MKRDRIQLPTAGLAMLLLAGCDRGPNIGIGVVNKTGMMITNCVVQFDQAALNTGVVLTNGRREFSYFDKPISETALLEIIFPDGLKRSLRAHVSHKFDSARPGTLLFEIGPEDVRVVFERAKK